MATPLRAIRINDELWTALQAAAAEYNTDASTVIRQLITDWLDSEPKQ